ncbi:guanylate-binding protein 1-like isoform X1 [Silurus meridionalis]|uniref:guanylate-binding protein 1-like isoform X1 n=1 Tax=Silurus meridionalis TaxID=175797 RepID=UPI001EEBA404|nr:guanylate-binding protein 1-like isoform X1 [Silurus meridionalis]XP_046731811.1 guanylate-binding protein 1-like isoform X1 [Silurus meridionalis]
MCSPMQEPVCLVENVNGSLRANDKAIQYLSRNNQPVVVVSVVGLYRTGKSYLMNRLAGQQSGFALGSTIESKTKGIWMWCVTHPRKKELTLVLLDTEGLGDVDKGDSKNDAWIFCLAVLLSSTLVYNSRGTIDNTAVEKLHYVTELAEQIKIKSPASETEFEEEEEEDSQFVSFFPNFIWTVRDFSLELVLEKRGEVTEDEYLDFALQLKKGFSKKDTNYNLPRQCIRNYFPTRKCFVFPFPASQEKMAQLESLDESDIYPKFMNVTQCFCDYVFAASKVKTVKGGHKVTGRMFGHLVQSYVEMITSGKVPCLENAVVLMAKIENEAAVQEGIKLYQTGMEQVKNLFPLTGNALFVEHQKLSNMANTEFIKRSFKDDEGKYFKKLMVCFEAVEKHYAELLCQNIDASEEKCQKILFDLYEDMNQCVQQGEYAKPGGYNLYCKHRDNLFAEYHRLPDKGMQAEVVLENFLSGKSQEATLILQTDEQLTESEKIIQEEKEQAALLEQKYKVEQEKKKEVEQLMQDHEQHYKQIVQQLERKFEEEKMQQQQEIDQALESKLKEQEELAQRKYEDKVQLMELEIEHLKKEKETQSSDIFKDYVMPLVDTATGVFSTVLQYKLKKSIYKNSKTSTQIPPQAESK